ncbi:MAG: putative rane protein [Actinomycetota bacterium]
MTAAVDPWRFHAHPEVWVLMVAIIVAYWYFLVRVGPTADRTAPDGSVEPIVTRRQLMQFTSGWLFLWIGADYPVHDIAEKYLFSVHMVQHMLFSLVAPGLLFLGIPLWLQRRLWGHGKPAAVLRQIGKPLIAGGAYTVWLVFSHWPVAMNAALRHEPIHFLMHLALFSTASLMWFPVLNRNPDLPMLSEVGRMVYVFLQSVMPTVPAAFFTFSDGVIYKFYAHVPHPFHIGAVSDQQLAGAIMKVWGGLLLWLVIGVMFFRWTAADEKARLARRRILTWDEVQAELDRTEAPTGG